MPHPPPRWRPDASFAHPLFWGGLLLLALNDHALKGSGALPAIVTGKLSDFAGLVVAPLVLAWLLRVRGERGWRLAHVAVGVGFALAQLAPVAAGIEQVALSLGLAVRLWPDPTDWIALPALLVSHRLLGPRSEATSPRRPLVGLVALVFCAATSATSPPPRYPFPPAGVLSTDVFVRHMASEDRTIGVRRLKDEVEVDCAGLLDVPERMLDGDDFGDEQEWTLSRGDAVPLWDRRNGAVDRECYAVRLRANGHEWYVTWRHGAPAVREIEIRLEPEDQAEPDAVTVPLEGEAPPRAPEGVTVHRPE